MPSHCGFPRCTLAAGHGGDFHVGPPVDPDVPNRRYLYPKVEVASRVLLTLGPGPYVGVLTTPGETDEDAVYRSRAGLDELDAIVRELEAEERRGRG